MTQVATPNQVKYQFPLAELVVGVGITRAVSSLVHTPVQGLLKVARFVFRPLRTVAPPSLSLSGVE